ncbi:MAG: hypothetical protein HY707_04790 [Ignavibacteriae bacterium]|nr:hypothetical protein [Ignavibacteriota bacterium]
MKVNHYMRRVVLILISLMLPQLLHGQGSHIRVSINSAVDTSQQEIASVIKLWEAYLNSNPDTLYDNPYWLTSEKERFKPFDFIAHTWWGVSLYAWLLRCHTTVLSVSKIGESYIIRTMLYNSLPRDSGKVSVVSIIQTGARLENGTYKLCNVLPINTRHWEKEQVGSIKFVFPPDHVFNGTLAERMNQFIDSVAAVWQITVVPIEYYFADDIDRVAKALGFDYWPAEGNIIGPRGFMDSKNRIIYSGGSNEWYPHEFVHLYINPLFPIAHHYFLEGYATLVGGSGGQDLLWHIRRNYEYLKDHPEIDVLTFKGVDMFTPASYFIGGLLCKMAEEKGGLQLIRKLMSYGKEDEDLYRAIQEVFGVGKEDINNFLRKKLTEYATK